MNTFHNLSALFSTGAVVGGGVTFWVPPRSETIAHTIYLYNEKGISNVLKIGKKSQFSGNFFENFESLLKVGDNRWEHKSLNYSLGKLSNTSWRIEGVSIPESYNWSSMHGNLNSENKGGFNGSITFYATGIKCKEMEDKVRENSPDNKSNSVSFTCKEDSEVRN